jgi:hypothetical protein
VFAARALEGQTAIVTGEGMGIGPGRADDAAPFSQ